MADYPTSTIIEEDPDERPIMERPDWLWDKWEDGTYVYWTREKVEIRNYIEYLEAKVDA